MSHFSVMVMSDDESGDVESLLAPFDEGIEVEKYLRHTKEELIQDKRDFLLRYKDKAYAEYLANPEEYAKKYANPEHLKYISEEFPKLLEQIDDDEVMYQEAISIYDEEDIDKETGGILSTYNPMSKWDWWVEGGRWSNFLRLLDGTVADCAYADEIDFTPSKEDIIHYGRLWDMVVEGAEPLNEDEEFSKNFYKKEDLEKEYEGRQDYIEKQSAFHTYAVVTPDGEWCEPGEMGWWGVSFATEEQRKDWNNNFYKFIEEAKENNYLITIVDCHI